MTHGISFETGGLSLIPKEFLVSNALTLPNTLSPTPAKAESAGALALAAQSMLPGQLGN
ncbi:RNA polymerase sigma factor RpoH, partial [Burkholderia cenocepacia]|nr:RNA polymerase sigma factor RpoH [Burkholderia cenocepacia]